MPYAAVFLTGVGGLLVELVVLRRFALLLGSTGQASALVIGIYLLGLGVGGLLAARALRWSRSALRSAAWLYAAVAVSSFLLDLVLRRTPPPALATGLGLALLSPGIPTLLMGMAFPLVFTALGNGPRRMAVGALIAANLAGSLVATALGGNLCIPELGLRASAALAAGAYLLAATLLYSARGRGGAPGEAARPEALPELGPLAAAAALSGTLVVGLQVLLLRRLPFFLEGFQPTLSGVLAACLLGLTLGSALGTPLLARVLRERAVGGALLLAAFSLALGLAEHAVPPLVRRPVSTELGMHARIWLAALAAAGPPCFFLGAVVPLAVSRFEEPGVRSALAGRLFFWQGVGSVAGTLLVGELLPALWPRGFFVAAAPVLALLCAPLVARGLGRYAATALTAAALGAALLGWSGPGPLLRPEPPLAHGAAGSNPALRFLDHRTDSTLTASVAYDRRLHSMVLYTNEFRAAETGPFADYMKVLGLLPFLLRGEMEHVAVIALGTGTTAEAVTLWPGPSRIDLVEISRAVFELAPHFAGDAPLRELRAPGFLGDPRARVHLTDGRRFLARCEPGSLDLITMEPLLPYSPGTASLYTREFYALAARALAPLGLLVQWVPTHAVPGASYRSLLATFARSFPHHTVWFLDGATILVGSAQPHLPSLELMARRLAAAPEAASLALHEARLAGPTDLLAALVGDDLLAVAGEAPDLVDDRPFVERVGVWKYDRSHLFFYRANFALLTRLAEHGGEGALHSAGWSTMRARRITGYRHLRDATRGVSPLASARRAAEELAAARATLPKSVVLHWEETLALRLVAELEFARSGGRGAAASVKAQLERDAGSALLQAALAFSGPDTDRALAPDQAVARAVAIAPFLFQRAPAFLARLAPREVLPSPLEGLETLPDGDELARLATGEAPRAVALRAAYRVRAARALIGLLAERRLRPDEQRALRPLLDPALLARAVEAVRARGGSPADEVGPLWREDLPLPPELAERPETVPAHRG
jgi:spermidine synthase